MTRNQIRNPNAKTQHSKLLDRTGWSLWVFGFRILRGIIRQFHDVIEITLNPAVGEAWIF